MEIKIKTLTPLWTGNVDRKCKTIKETGIIGSLRWWYEALVRGLGGHACDPTSSSCEGVNHCDVCELFGCTGWSRKFRLECSFQGKMIPTISIRTRERHRTRGGMRYLPRVVSGLCTKSSFLDFNLISLKKFNKREWFLLGKTLEIIEKYGGLGARVSQGYGTIEISKLDIPKINLGNSLEERKSELSKYWNKDFKGKFEISPNICEFFFWKIQLGFNESIENLIMNELLWGIRKNEKNTWLELWKRLNFIPISFHVRDTIRYSLPKNRRHGIFGKRGRGSKIFVSHGYGIDGTTIELRIFGYGLSSKELGNMGNKLNEDLKEKLFFEEGEVTINKVADVRGSDLL